MPVDLSHVTRIHCYQDYRNAGHWEGRTINDMHSASRSLKNGLIVRHVIAKGLWRIPIRMGEVIVRWRDITFIVPLLTLQQKLALFSITDSKGFRHYLLGVIANSV